VVDLMLMSEIGRDTYRQTAEETGRRKSESTVDVGDLKTLERSGTKV
jgi:hypothetical protein